MEALKPKRNVLSEVSMKCQGMFNATSFSVTEKTEIISDASEASTKSDFFDCMPLWADRNSFAKKGRDSQKMQDTHSVFDNLVTRTELSEKLGLSESYISKLMSDENLPYFKIGRSVRFRLTEVVVWLQTRRRP